MKLAEYKYRVICPGKWSDEQIEDTLKKLEIVEERIIQYLRDNVYTISEELRVESD